MNIKARIERLNEQHRDITAEIERQQRRLRPVQLSLLQEHSAHNDIGNGKKLLMTAEAVEHITSGGRFGHKDFDQVGIVVKIYDWDCETLTCNIRPDERWGGSTNTAIDIPLAIIDQMRQAFLDSVTEKTK
ncbi:hypothetical protein LCGC14_1358920 [marine sediment metagenome]|uniref:Uncharacterized protein n=1 Tax=marine sediment metagenome TaxID=412755 RepID=A0A0F9K8M2_9ZZZZ